MAATKSTPKLTYKDYLPQILAILADYTGDSERSLTNFSIKFLIPFARDILTGTVVDQKSKTFLKDLILLNSSSETDFRKLNAIAKYVLRDFNEL